MTRYSRTPLMAAPLLALAMLASTAVAHPLGNASTDQLVSVEPSADRIAVRYIADIAEIPSTAELSASDLDGDGTTTQSELESHLASKAETYGAALVLTIDGRALPLRIDARRIEHAAGARGLSTLRVELDLSAAFVASDGVHRLRLTNANFDGRPGWREIAVTPRGVSVFDTTAFAGSASEELRAPPGGRLRAPLDERTVELSYTVGALPAGALPLRTRAGGGE